MSADNAVGLALAIVLTVYLVAALERLFPERL